MSDWMEAVQQWEMCRTGVVGELRALDPEYLDVRPAKGARTARELAVHLLEAGRGFAQRLETGAPFAPGSSETSPTATADELAVALMEDWTTNVRPRVEALEGRADTVMESFFGQKTLLWQLWFAISHEWYHRGQLATYVRLSGKVPALTQYIEQVRSRTPG